MNLFFLLNIVRVLITKLKKTHCAETTTYMKAVRATLILIPLLGVQFILLPWRPEGRISCAVYEFFMNIFCHYQVPATAVGGKGCGCSMQPYECRDVWDNCSVSYAHFYAEYLEGFFSCKMIITSSFTFQVPKQWMICMIYFYIYIYILYRSIRISTFPLKQQHRIKEQF